ncbi:hypothetical protein [Lentzea sp. HUAS12]|uniref:hypothetical protein n=1 Tax=Lentzea sp. HUAS12 TaxID=2951806 RepID=UPI00209E15DE|nr:hypothetical protein [Lentzea sp. HUAS12]USX54446.1 hypothetical protein ND450_10185 [Lentzea sp. HUAS12]
MNTVRTVLRGSAAAVLAFGSSGGVLPTPAGAVTTTSTPVVVLESLGGSAYPNALNEHDLVAGIAYLGDGSARAVRWDRRGRITRLGRLSGETSSTAVDLNDAGTAVGTSAGENGHTRAVRWARDGTVADLGTLPGEVDSTARVINDRGTVIGEAGNGLSPGPGVLWDATGAITEISPRATLSGLNNLDVVVGNEGAVARKWDRHGGRLPLDRLPDEAWSVARGINDRGTAFGYAGTADGRQYTVRWDSEGRVAVLRDLRDSTRSTPVEIDSHDEIAGFAVVSGPEGFSHAVRWDENGRARDLGTLGGRQSMSNDINDEGTVVGWADVSPRSFESHAVRWSRTGRASDLGTLPGATSSTAAQINNRGTITGWATTADHSRAVLWPTVRPRSETTP